MKRLVSFVLVILSLSLFSVDLSYIDDGVIAIYSEYVDPTSTESNLSTVIAEDALGISPCTKYPCLAQKMAPLRTPNRTKCGRLWALPMYGPGNVITTQQTLLILADLLECKPEVMLFDILRHYQDEQKSQEFPYVVTLDQLYDASSYGQKSLRVQPPEGDVFVIDGAKPNKRRKDMYGVDALGKIGPILKPYLNQTLMTPQHFSDSLSLTEQLEEVAGSNRDYFKLMSWNPCGLHPTGIRGCSPKEKALLREKLYGNESPFAIVTDVQPTPPQFAMSAQVRVSDHLWKTDDVMDRKFNASDLLRERVKNGAFPPISLREILHHLVSVFEPGPIYLTAPPVWHFWEAVDEINRVSMVQEGKPLIYNVSSFESSAPEMLLDHHLLASASIFVYDGFSSYSQAAMVRRHGTTGTISMGSFLRKVHGQNGKFAK